MDWSTRKKFGCFTIMGIVLIAIIGYFVYTTFIAVSPTCFDGKQNQNERGVDCGGVCQLVCPTDAKTIVSLWSRAFEITKGVYNVVSYVENQNISAGTEKINYEIRVYDDQNILASEPITGSTFIGPNDKTAIFESPIQTGNRIPKNVFLKFTTAPEWKQVDERFQKPQLTSTNTIFSDLDTAPKLSADIINNTLFDYTNIPVIVLLYGADGNVVQASKTQLDFIAQQSTEKVFFTWPQKFSGPIVRAEIIPRVNPFENR